MKKSLTINLRGKLYDLTIPRVMGIINITPDSFFAGSRTFGASAIEQRVAQMVADGVDMLDLGGYSTRPGADEVSAEEEYDRLARALEIIKRDYPDMPVSIDTFRGEVARRCVEQWGADIINDVSGGTIDPSIWEVAVELNVPYVLMHMRGTPATMQTLTDYDDVTCDVLRYLAEKSSQLHALGVSDVILDPGFGFSKTVEQNFCLMAELEQFAKLGMPLLVGISHKSMIWRLLDITPAEALNGTTVLNTLALERGANILRVHDVREAREAVRLVAAMNKSVEDKCNDC